MNIKTPYLLVLLVITACSKTPKVEYASCSKEHLLEIKEIVDEGCLIHHFAIQCKEMRALLAHYEYTCTLRKRK
jgi:hypothetical protein